MNWFCRIEVQGTSTETKRSVQQNFEACTILQYAVKIRDVINNK